MPTICMFRGIKIYINWRDHQPPHFHASYGGDSVIVSIRDIEVLEGEMPNKQLKMFLGGRPSIKTSSLRTEPSLRRTRSSFPLILFVRFGGVCHAA